ncbi:T9SS type A sorting domain-containing protein [Flavobacterium franklandianum]|uniref:T9SS type A sorting domain-containing protein n=1 Tax=Flavobacterium franklandianum TaxID=2594430 RepID=A0A553CQQ2_9FLAO|nr:T9SS type A sorting domain-containing protein [Flavobacterium franklandianum]TRX22724.1 T9SS type A sorting domain-containing protein [Flavobacterium franklandianum]TRX26572.1 T9SS type A sorting domain-containing protein [Flavobacterium franklandianum]
MKKLLLFLIMMSSFVANAQFWSEKATGFATANRTLSSISIVDASVIWGIALDNSAIPDYTIKEFTKSTDGGETWTPGTINLGTNTAGLGITSISAISDQIAWISAAPDVSDLGGVWKTTDGGLTWTKQTTALFNNPTDSYTSFVHFWDALNGVTGGDTESGSFEIYTTSDGGNNWNRVIGANIPDSLAGETGYVGVTSISGNTFWFGTSAGRIFKSMDKGLSWTVTDSVVSIDFGLDRFSFSDANKGILMVEDTQKLYKTTDGGTTWTPITTPDFYKTVIAYIPGTSTVIAGAAANPFGSSYSIDNGLTWTTIDTAVFHGTLAFLNDSFGFSAGMNTDATTGGISKFTGIPLKNPSFDNNKQIAAYPNPTNGTLYLKSETSLIKEASVFDLLGKQVYKSNFSALNNVNLDLKSLQTGAYLLKVTSDSGKTETIKIMKN